MRTRLARINPAGRPAAAGRRRRDTETRSPRCSRRPRKVVATTVGLSSTAARWCRRLRRHRHRLRRPDRGRVRRPHLRRAQRRRRGSGADRALLRLRLDPATSVRASRSSGSPPNSGGRDPPGQSRCARWCAQRPGFSVAPSTPALTAFSRARQMKGLQRPAPDGAADRRPPLAGLGRLPRRDSGSAAAAALPTIDPFVVARSEPRCRRRTRPAFTYSPLRRHQDPALRRGQRSRGGRPDAGLARCRRCANAAAQAGAAGRGRRPAGVKSWFCTVDFVAQEVSRHHGPHPRLRRRPGYTGPRRCWLVGAVPRPRREPNVSGQVTTATAMGDALPACSGPGSSSSDAEQRAGWGLPARPPQQVRRARCRAAPRRRR